MEAGFAYCYMVEQTDAGPTFFYFIDGMKDEKVWATLSIHKYVYSSNMILTILFSPVYSSFLYI